MRNQHEPDVNQQDVNQQDVEDVIASDLLGGDILHRNESTGAVLPSDEVRIIEGGITDASGMVALGGSSDVGGTNDTLAGADVGATTGAGALGSSPTED